MPREPSFQDVCTCAPDRDRPPPGAVTHRWPPQKSLAASGQRVGPQPARSLSLGPTPLLGQAMPAPQAEALAHDLLPFTICVYS